MDREEIKQKYLRQFSFKQNSNKLFIIGFVGLPGSGKSTIAKLISKQIDMPITSNDHIRRYFDSVGLPSDQTTQDFLQEIAEARTELLLANSVSHIVDADLYMFVDEAQRRATRFDAELLLIDVKSTEEKILDRISKRTLANEDLSTAGIDTYFRRKYLVEYHTKNLDFYYQIQNNDSSTLEDDVMKLVNKIVADGYITKSKYV